VLAETHSWNQTYQLTCPATGVPPEIEWRGHERLKQPIAPPQLVTLLAELLVHPDVVVDRVEVPHERLPVLDVVVVDKRRELIHQREVRQIVCPLQLEF